MTQTFRDCLATYVDKLPESDVKRVDRLQKYIDRAIDDHEHLKKKFVDEGVSEADADVKARQTAADNAVREKKEALVLREVIIRKQAEHGVKIEQATSRIKGTKDDPTDYMVNVVRRFENAHEQVKMNFGIRLFDIFEEHGFKGLGLSRKKEGLDELVDAIFGKDAPADAKKMANAYKAFTIEMNAAFREAGIPIKDDLDFNLPQKWDAAKMTRQNPAGLDASMDEWVADALGETDGASQIGEMFDWKLMAENFSDKPMPTTLEGKRQLLYNVFRTIAFDGTNKIDVHAPRNGSSFASKMSHRRFLRFKNAEAWKYMNEKYMEGDVFDAIVGHYESAAHDLAMVQTFGPNPNATKSFIENKVLKTTEEQGNTKQFNKVKDQIGPHSSAWNKAWSSLNRRNMSSPDNKLANTYHTFSSGITGSFLTGTGTLAAMTDIVFFNTARKITGVKNSGMGRYAAAIAEGFNPANAADRTKLLRFTGALDTLISQHTTEMRLMGEMGGRNVLEKYSDVMLRTSGMPQITQMGRAAARLDYMGMVTDNLGKKYDELDKTARWFMERETDMTAEVWDVLSKFKDYAKGQDYDVLRPRRILDMIDMEPDELKKIGVTAKEARHAAEVYSAAIIGADNLSIPQARMFAKNYLTGGGSAGDVSGAIGKSIGMLKTFPITIFHEQMSMYAAAAYQQGGRHWGTIPMLVLSLSVGAGLNEQLKLMLRGYEPQDMWDAQFMARALLKGGGLGILGDFLYSDTNRYGGGMADTLAGPMWSIMSQGLNMTAGNVRDWYNGDDIKFADDAMSLFRTINPAGRHPFTALANSQILGHAMGNLDSYERYMRDKLGVAPVIRDAIVDAFD